MNPIHTFLQRILILISIVAGCLYLVPTRAHAFAVGLSASGPTLTAGTCDFRVSATNTIILSSIWLFVENGSDSASPQGSYYQKVVAGVDIVLGVPAIDVAFLQDECGLTNVTITKNEANGISYSSATNYELEFTGQESGAWKIWHGRIFAAAANQVPQLTMTKTDFVPTAPSVVSIERQGSATLGAGQTPIFTVTFDEPVTNVSADDFLLSGPSPVAVSAVSANGSSDVWTVEIAGAGLANYNGTLGITVSPGATINALDNGVLLDSGIAPLVNETYTIDTSAPALTTLHMASNNTAPSLAKAGDEITAYIVFAEPLVSAPTVTIGGVIATVNAGAPGNYTATVNVTVGTTEGPQPINVSGISDLYGNIGAAISATTNSSSVSVDVTPPSVTITTSAIPPVNGLFSVNYNFSEPVTGFSGLGVISLLGGLTTLPVDSGDGQTFTSLITPILDPVISVAAGVVSDAAGNLNIVSNTLNVATDLIASALVLVSVESDSADLGGTKARAGDTITVNFQSNVELRDMPVVTIAGLPATVVNESGMTEFSASVLIGSGAVAQGNVAISISGLVDLLDDIIAAVTATTDSSSVSIDNILPVATLSSAIAGPVNANNLSPFDVTVALNEPISGLNDLSKFEVQNATLSNLTQISALEYSVTLTPDGNGNISLGLLGNTLLDLHLNTNLLSNILNILLIDNLAPSVAVTTISGSQTFPQSTLDPFDIQVDFSEPVFGFTLGDLSLTNAAAAQIGSPSHDPQGTFQFTVTPDGNGDVTINLAAGSATDSAGNPNIAAATLTIQMSDNTSPSVSVTSDLNANGVVQQLAPFTVTLTFSEPVAGFDNADLAQTNVNIGAITPTNVIAEFASIFTAQATPVTHGNISISVNGNVAQDASGNFNTASQTFYAMFVDQDYVQTRTGAVINNFLNRRVKNMAANQPDLSGRLSDQGGLGASENFSYAAKVREGEISASFEGSINRLLKALPESFGEEDEQRSKHNLWVRGSFSQSSSTGVFQDFGILHFGADYRLNNNVLVGALAQFDWASEQFGNEGISASGQGWMVGPYAVIRLADNIIFDGRVTYGQSENMVSPYGTYEDRFQTERLLFHGQLTGNFDLGGWTVTPALSMTYIRENQKAYIDTNDVLIGPQIVELGSLKFGPSFSRHFYSDNGVRLSPHLSLKGIWNFKDTGIQNIENGIVTTDNKEQLHARIDAGLDIRFNQKNQLDLSAFYEGIGQADNEIYGGAVKLRIPF